MSLSWNTKQEGVIKVKDAASNDMLSFNGISADITENAGFTPEQAAECINFLLAIGGRSCVADENMKFEITREVN